MIEGFESERLEPGEGFGEAHANRLVRLVGRGEEGCGEDITLFMSEAPAPALEGEWTLDSFYHHLTAIEQWAEPPDWEMARRWRDWSYESSALDLALRQAGESLHERLGLEPRPVTFVNSLDLGAPPSPDTVLRRLSHYPQLRFKLDAKPDWTPEIVDVLVGAGAVDTVDFKGHYGMEIEDMPALISLYERVLDAFPDALVEDPHDLPEVGELLQPHLDRVAYDAPIAAVADLDATPLEARTFNIKPSRVGRLETLFELYATCEERGLAIYGGGMGELGIARDQIQLLASMFSPDAPNDIAPSGFNALDPAPGPRDESVAGGPRRRGSAAPSQERFPGARLRSTNGAGRPG